MKKLLTGLVLAIAGYAGSASATLIDIDVSSILFTDEINLTCCTNPTGGFRFDTDTLAVTDVNVTSRYGGYNLGIFDDASDEFTLLSNVSATVMLIDINFPALVNDLVTAMPGETLEVILNTSSVLDNTGIVEASLLFDSALFATVVDETPPPQVPLPAGLPLMLAGLGAFGMMRRKR